MSVVVSNLQHEVAALKSFKGKPLPPKCKDNGFPDKLNEFLRACSNVERLLKLHNKNNKGVAMQTPYEIVREYYQFPFELYPFQERTANTLAPLPKAGYYLDMSLGKTAISMVSALYQTLHQGCERILIIVPPVLMTQWARFIASIEDKETGPVSSLVYRGTPKQRKAMNLDADITVVGIQIFKKDYARFLKAYEGVRTVVIVDEAHALKNSGSDNHEKVRDFVAEDNHLMLLTGTPVNSPIDAYGMVKLIAPNIYRNRHQFERIHVAERDFFDKVVRWQNLDLLKENLAVNSIRLIKEDCLLDLPPVSYETLFYDLEPEHLKLYRKLAEEHLIPLENGGKVDATSVQALLHALGQLVCNWGHFAQNDSKVSAGFNLVDEVLDELGEGKLVLFSGYKLTNRYAMKHFKHLNPVAIYGDVSAADRDRAIDKFVEDPSCRLFIGNVQSAAFGIDRLQLVCSTVMYLEAPPSVSAFTQSIARIHRLGQTRPVSVKLATAVDTLQERQMRALLEKQDLVQMLTGGGLPSIREALGLR